MTSQERHRSLSLVRISAFIFLMSTASAYAGTITLPQASTMAPRIDALHDFIVWASVIGLALVTGALIYFVFKFHRSQTGRKTEYILGSHFLEALWTVIPLFIFLFIFAWGWKQYAEIRTEAVNPVEINVTARQWLWNFEYTNGRKTLNELYVPKHVPVKLIMTSEDVIHSFFVPNFRLKQDVVPGMFTSLSFEATLLGEHPIYCAEYCGTGHSNMLGKVVVLEKENYNQWLETGNVLAGAQLGTASGTAQAAMVVKGEMGQPLAEKGKAVFQSKGCVACHSTDGSPRVGPSLLHVFGKTEALEGGKSVKVDENYIVRSVMEPQADIVKGYPRSMPSYKGLVSDDEMKVLIAYIKSLK